jgi:hypothetical protein
VVATHNVPWTSTDSALTNELGKPSSRPYRRRVAPVNWSNPSLAAIQTLPSGVD